MKKTLSAITDIFFLLFYMTLLNSIKPFFNRNIGQMVNELAGRKIPGLTPTDLSKTIDLCT